MVQLATASLMCLIGTLPHGVRPPDSGSAWTAVLITAVPASAFAYMVQTWAQKHVTATQAAVILTMEPVFAGLSAVLAGGEPLTLSTLVGGALVVTAMFLVQVPGSTSEASASDAEHPQSDQDHGKPQLWAKEPS